jgi:hypothetical protein
MNQIIPDIKLHTLYRNQGTHINALILNHQGNNYHFEGRTSDTIHVFTEGLGIYVLTINRRHPHISMNSYMAPESDPINMVYLHNLEEIVETLGKSWETMKALNVANKLINLLF